jgi:hypothetical protein
MKGKWKVRKGCLKIHVAVNVKSKKILSWVIDEHVDDGKVLPELVDDITKSNRETMGKLLPDGACDGNDVFRCLSDNGIYSCVKVGKNARVRVKADHILRNLSVLSQRNDFGRWEDSVSYGRRWIAETVFSPIKRASGEHVYSVKFENMVKELMLKVSLHNKFVSF